MTNQASTKKTTAGEVLKILQNEKDRRDSELEKRLAELTEFKKNNPGITYESKQGNIIIDKLAMLSDVLTHGGSTR